MPHFFLTTEVFWLWILLFLLIATFTGWWYYRTTIPPLQLRQRLFLGILKGIGFFLILLLLTKPIIRFVWQQLQQPVIAVLVDNSKSMTLKDGAVTRFETVLDILQNNQWEELRKNRDIRMYAFDSKIRQFHFSTIDSLTFQGDATFIALAFKQLQKESRNLQAVVLISDGNMTDAISPLYDALRLNVPVYTIGIGDTALQKDLLIKRVITNDICYAGSKVPVLVHVQSSGYEGEEVIVSLNTEGKTLTSAKLTMLPGVQNYTVPLSFVAEGEGEQKYNIVVSHLPGEITFSNNKYVFFSKVVSKKTSVAVISAAPTADVGFFKRAIASDTMYQVLLYLQKPDGSFKPELNTDQLKKVDCIVFIGYPDNRSNVKLLQDIQQQLTLKPMPICFIIHINTEFEKLKILERFLPAEVQKIHNREIQVQPIVENEYEIHPLIRVASDVDKAVWQQLPPIFTVPLKIVPKTNSNVVLHAQAQSSLHRQPLVVLQKTPNHRVSLVLGYGLWRWKMLTDRERPVEQIFDGFVKNTMQWLTLSDDEEKIRVQTTKKQFSTGENIHFIAQIFDDNYRAIENAEVFVNIQRESETYEYVLTSLGNGQYEIITQRLPAGDYRFTAQVRVDGKTIGSAKGIFTVGEVHDEYIETSMNIQLLRSLAVRTNGQFYYNNNIEPMFREFDELPTDASEVLQRTYQYELLNSVWMLILIVSIFSIEWFVRKRYGLL